MNRPASSLETDWTCKLLGPTHRLSRRLWFKAQQFVFANPATWKRRHPLKAPAKRVVVRFVIPLISPAKANDWSTVCNNLKATLDALRRQTSSEWTVTITCQHVPDGILFDEKIRFLPYRIPSHPTLNDKQEKLRTLIDHASRGDRNDGYIFFLDGDDIPHPTLVEYIISDNNGHGYYLPQGYLVDRQRHLSVGFGIPPYADHPFYLINGSTSALRFDLTKNRAHTIPALLRGPHEKTPDRIRNFGFDIQPVPFPAMLYMFNHGDNLELHRGRGSLQLNALDNCSKDKKAFATIMQEFEYIIK